MVNCGGGGKGVGGNGGGGYGDNLVAMVLVVNW